MLTSSPISFLSSCAHSREGIIFVDNRIVHFANPAFKKLSGKNAENMHIDDLFPRHICDIITGDEEIFDKLELFGRHMDIRILHMNFATVVVFTDISAINRELNHHDKTFSAMRETNSTIASYLTSLLCEFNHLSNTHLTDISDDTADHIASMRSQMKDISNLILITFDLLDTVGSYRECSECNLTEIIRKEVANARSQFKELALRIDFNDTHDILFPLELRSAAHMIFRLLAYAAQRSSPGDRITIATETDDSHARIILTIPQPAERETFERFVATPSTHEGRMLDLYLVRRIAISYDGSLDISGTSTRTKITVTIPKAVTKPYVREPINSPGLNNTIDVLFANRQYIR